MKEIQLNIESNENLPYIESIKFKFDLEILISKINKLTKIVDTNNLYEVKIKLESNFLKVIDFMESSLRDETEIIDKSTKVDCEYLQITKYNVLYVATSKYTNDFIECNLGQILINNCKLDGNNLLVLR